MVSRQPVRKKNTNLTRLLQEDNTIKIGSPHFWNGSTLKGEDFISLASKFFHFEKTSFHIEPGVQESKQEVIKLSLL